ncbi:MAG TPA: hypothetical protein GXX55_04740 [Firmicutes bacterium]|nr:hypothetical protein [Bacillota bacterium]
MKSWRYWRRSHYRLGFSVLGVGLSLAFLVVFGTGKSTLAAGIEFHGDYSAWQKLDWKSGNLENLHNDLSLEMRVRPARGVELYWRTFSFYEHAGTSGTNIEQFHATLDTENFDVRVFSRERPNPTDDPLHIFHPNRWGSSETNFTGTEVQYTHAGWKLSGSVVKLHPWGGQWAFNGRVETVFPIPTSPLKIGATYSSQVWSNLKDFRAGTGGRAGLAIDAAFTLGELSVVGEMATFRAGTKSVRGYYLNATQPIGKAQVQATYRSFPKEIKTVFDNALGDPAVLTGGRLTRVAVGYPLADQVNGNLAVQTFVTEDTTTRTYEAGIEINRADLMSPALALTQERVEPGESGGEQKTTTTVHAELNLPFAAFEVAKLTADRSSTIVAGAAKPTTAWTLVPQFAYRLNDRVKIEGKAQFKDKLEGAPAVYGKVTYTVPAWVNSEAALELEYGDSNFDASKAQQILGRFRVKF